MNRTTAIPLIFSVTLCGCSSVGMAPPAPADYYYVNPGRNLSTVGRVAIVELDNYSSYPDVSADVTDAIFQELQKKQVFSLTIVRRHNAAWRSLQLDLSSGYQLEELVEIREALKCSAVLVGSVTEFRPYPHVVVGLRMKLLDLEDGQLLWALEQIWDAADKTTEDRVRKYVHHQMHPDFSSSRQHVLAVSPTGFIKFVAYEVGQTLSRNRQPGGLAGLSVGR